MKKRIIVCIIGILIIAISILVGIYIGNKITVYNANLRAEEIVIGDNTEIQDIAVENIISIQENEIVAFITIPDILLEKAPIYEGIELDILDKGIGHFPTTSIYSGNVGLAGHNYNQDNFLGDLYKVNIGSKIYYETDFGTKRYLVEKIETIDESDWSLLQNTEDNRITLITCINGEETKRLCVQGKEF